MNSSEKNNIKSDENTVKDSGQVAKKSWSDPLLVVEDVESTKGGTLSCNAPGDDSWYVS